MPDYYDFDFDFVQFLFRISVNLAHHLPPSGLSSRTMDWAARQASAARKKQSSAAEGKIVGEGGQI